MAAARDKGFKFSRLLHSLVAGTCLGDCSIDICLRAHAHLAPAVQEVLADACSKPVPQSDISKISCGAQGLGLGVEDLLMFHLRALR